jgi:hypothetical protein
MTENADLPIVVVSLPWLDHPNGLNYESEPDHTPQFQ